MGKIRLGVVGTGVVANFMTAYMLFHPDIEIVCVASRSCEKAQRFAQSYFIPYWTDDYRKMVNYELDMVYVATLPDVHFKISKYFLNCGIGVLCEKPLVFQKNDLEELLLLSKEKNVLFMENLVTAYLPSMQAIVTCLQKAGNVREIHLSIGNKHEPDESRLFTDKEYGGVFCDLSCYVLYFVSHIMQEYPARIESQSIYYQDKIDQETNLHMYYQNGVQAICRMSVMEDTEGTAWIICENGTIKVEDFGRGGNVYWFAREKEKLIYASVYRFHGFEYVLDEMIKCCKTRVYESSFLTHTQMYERTCYMIDMLPKIKEIQ